MRRDICDATNRCSHTQVNKTESLGALVEATGKCVVRIRTQDLDKSRKYIYTLNFATCTTSHQTSFCWSSCLYVQAFPRAIIRCRRDVARFQDLLLHECQPSPPKMRPRESWFDKSGYKVSSKALRRNMRNASTVTSKMSQKSESRENIT